MAGSPIDNDDESFILACTGLVMFMTPGLALFYGGLVRERGAIDMMIQNMVSLGISSITWYLFVFSLAFGPGHYIGDYTTFSMFKGLDLQTTWPNLTISGELFATYQMMFAIITPILMTGAFADRMYFGPFCVFLVLWNVLVYAPWCHQIWGGGRLQEQGVWDFAGGIVVHSTAGWSALASCFALGKRKVKATGGDIPEPHSMPVVVLGTGILWFGWFGFNGGSSLAINNTAVGAVINSQMSAATAIVVWGAIDWIREGKPKLVPMCIACVAGLVVVTPSCGYISTNMAIVTGVIAGTVCYAGIFLLNKAGVDDALDVWGVHGLGGATGTILIGIMSDGAECLEKDYPDYCIFPGSVASSFEQTKLQVKAVFTCICYSFTMTFTILKMMELVVTIQPPDQTDDFRYDNLDELLHGEATYSMAPVSSDNKALIEMRAE